MIVVHFGQFVMLNKISVNLKFVAEFDIRSTLLHSGHLEQLASTS